MSYLFIVLVFLLIVINTKTKRKKQVEVLKRIRKGRNKIMNGDMLKAYIGKECVVYVLDKYVSGTVEAVNDNWLNIKTQDGLEMINIEYIVRIKEYPLDKNGKKKWLVDW